MTDLQILKANILDDKPKKINAKTFKFVAI